MSKNNRLVLSILFMGLGSLGAYAYSKKDEIKKLLVDSANKDLSKGISAGGGITNQYGGGEPIAGTPESTQETQSSVITTPSGNSDGITATDYSYSPDTILDSGSEGKAGAYYDSSGKIVGVADPISKQSRAPTPVEKLSNKAVYGSSKSTSSSASKSSALSKVTNVVKKVVTIPTKITSIPTKILSSGIKKIFGR